MPEIKLYYKFPGTFEIAQRIHLPLTGGILAQMSNLIITMECFSVQ